MINIANSLFKLEQLRYSIISKVDAAAERELFINQIQLNLLLAQRY
jgi:hypothetical protein